MKTALFAGIVALGLLGGIALAEPTAEEICEQATALLAGGKQCEAEELVRSKVNAVSSERLMFLHATLIRSRFDLEGAFYAFRDLARAFPNSLETKVAARVVRIDQGQDVEKNFLELSKLCGDHPNDPLVLWLVAIECRQLNLPRIGIERYEALLKLWNPGPSLLHQTYGNLLLDDGQFERALEHYDLSIQMEPKSWNYNTRGCALMELKRYVNAAEAFKVATNLNPGDPLPWINWARLCELQGDKIGAAAKRAAADEIQRRTEGN